MQEVTISEFVVPDPYFLDYVSYGLALDCSNFIVQG
jgi:hypothetical protein